jgi:predicted transcriptional regulator
MDIQTQMLALEVDEVARLYERNPASKPSTPEQDAWLTAFADYFAEKNEAYQAGDGPRWEAENPEMEFRERRQAEVTARNLRTKEARDAYLLRVRAEDPGDGSLIRKAERIVLRSVLFEIDPKWNGEKPMIGEPIQLTPEDQAALAESILNPPPLAEALRRAFERREQRLQILAAGEREVEAGLVEPVDVVFRRIRTQGLEAAAEEVEGRLGPVFEALGQVERPTENELREELFDQAKESTEGKLAPVLKSLASEPPVADCDQLKFPQAMRVRELVPIYCGDPWIEGFDVLHPGCELLLLARNEDVIDFVLGTRPVKYGEPRSGGWIHVDRLGSLEPI